MPLEVSTFTEEVFHLVENLKKDLKRKNKPVSDIIDDAGYQYVDFVMEGGGVLGIALVGFTYVLEQAGIRFLQIGGASAGAINALLLAALGAPAEAKSEKILRELANVDMYEFVDGDGDARSFIDSWLSNENRLSIGFKALQVVDNINDELGLNPGEKFREWIVGILEKERIRNTADLEKRLGLMPTGLRHREGKPIDHIRPNLALVAADVSTQTKAVFPRMAGLYWKNPDRVNPAHYVRASMSIPFFFQPLRIDNIPRGTSAMALWKQYADYEQSIPKSCVFIDGGIMSNFPINLFHRPDRVPSAPTFGVKLGVDDRKTDDISKPFGLLKVIFDSARFNLDADFIARNPDYRKLVSCIGTGDHNWLNFGMSDDDKLDLFKKGAAEADRFLRQFDWEEYKDIRRGIAQTINDADLKKETMAGDAVRSAVKST
jgi:NTE family protein